MQIYTNERLNASKKIEGQDLPVDQAAVASFAFGGEDVLSSENLSGPYGEKTDGRDGITLLNSKPVNKSTSVDDTVSWCEHSDWRALVVAGLHEAGFDKDAEAFERCGKEVLHIACRACGEPKDVPMSCNLRICPECSRRFAARMADQIADVWHSIPKSGFWLLKKITLTVKTDGDLQKAWDEGWKAIPKLWRKHLKVCDDSGAVLSGMVVSAEFGPKNGNVHFHVLFYGPYIPQADLSKWWYELTGSYVVDIRRAVQPGQNVMDAIQEAVKYPTKFYELPPELLVQVHGVMKGSRRIRTYGVFYGEIRIKPVVVCVKCGNDTWKVLAHRTAWGVWNQSPNLVMLGSGAGGKAR